MHCSKCNARFPGEECFKNRLTPKVRAISYVSGDNYPEIVVIG